jgi:hypothetical protein
MALTRRNLASLAVHGQHGIIINLRKADRAMRSAVIKVTQKNGRACVKLAKALCPVDTGRMRRSITGKPSPTGITYSVFYEPSFFTQDGVTYYPYWVEKGTRRMPARPVLTWAKRQIDPIHKRDVAEAIRSVTR